MKTHEATEKFLIYGRADREYAPESRQKLLDCFASWILPRLGNREIETVCLQDVIELRVSMTSRGLSAARVSSVLAALKVLLRFCRTVLRLACMDPSEIKLPPRKKPHVEFIGTEGVGTIREKLDARSFTDLRTRALCELILGTGVRLGEALRLDRTPFERNQPEMDIVGKGGKVRTIFFTEESMLWVRRFLAIRADSHPAVFVTTGDSPRRWARADVSRFFIDLSRRVGFRVTPHLLRHTYCTTLLNNGVDITFIKELAGHEDIQTTARYYLGVDKPALRRIVKERLKYASDATAVDTSVPLT